MPIRRRESDRDRIGVNPGSFAAGERSSDLAAQAPGLLERAVGIQWYDRPGNDADVAAYTLCRLRRARAGEGGSQLSGDEAVRQVLGEAEPEALVWLASRTVSYLDEHGFPEAVEPWLPPDSR